jgi:hypothetical protein
MKSLNGLLFIVLGCAIIWVGATGRFPALAKALGMIQASPGGVTSGGSSATKAATVNPINAGVVNSANMLNQPQSVVWQEALKNFGLAGGVAK